MQGYPIEHFEGPMKAAPIPARLYVRLFPRLTVVRGGVRGKKRPTGRRRALRGVRETDYTINGCPVFEAIASTGECVKRVVQRPGVDAEVIREWLWGYLERVDHPKLVSLG